MVITSRLICVDKPFFHRAENIEGEGFVIGLLYRNTRTSCVSLALLCARISHDTLPRVLYQKVPWSRRIWDCFARGLVQMGGSVVIDDTSRERFTRVADAVSWGWSSRVGKPVWGMPVVLL
jgi:hypothetical protein